MSLCENVYRRGAVYWWRKKIVVKFAIKQEKTKTVVALSLKVREPGLAKQLAALLNAKVYSIRAALMTGKLTIPQTRAILAHFIEAERDALDNSIFRARNTPRSPDLLPHEDDEAILIRDQRVLAAAYAIASKHEKLPDTDEAAQVASFRARGFTEEEAYIIIDYLKIWQPTMTEPGADGFGPPLDYLKTALANVGAEPTPENIDILWRQFLGVRAKALGDYQRRHGADPVGIDDLFNQSTKNRLAKNDLGPPAFDLARNNPTATMHAQAETPQPPSSSAAAEARGLACEASGATLAAPAPVSTRQPPAPPTEAATACGETDLAQRLLSEVSAEFQRKTYEVRTERSPKGENKSASNHAVLIWVLGDRPISCYTCDDVSKFEDVYRKLPNDYKNFRREGQSAKEVGEQAEKARKGLPNIADLAQRQALENRLKRLSVKTFNAKIGAFKELLVFAKLPNVTAGWHQPVDKTKNAQRGERPAPELETVERLFNSSVWTGRQSGFRLVRPGEIIIRDSLYWIPLLCAHHGLRLDEAAQLRGRHVVKINGVRCFDLRSDPSLILKNGNARRLIPIHEKMFDLGFGQILDKLAADAQLFPELSNDNKNKSYGESVSKRYGRYLQEIFGPEIAKTLTSHCFRHFVATQLGNNLAFKDSWVNELMAHEGERISEAERYNKLIYVENLKKMVDSIVVPVDYAKLRKLADEAENRQRAQKALPFRPRHIAHDKR